MLIIKNRYEIQALAKKHRMPKVYDVLGKLKEAKDNIAKTDGKHIYIDPEEFNALPAEDDFFILCHELLHIVYRHTDKTYYPLDMYPNRELLNICQDVVINTYLQNKLKFRQKDGLYLDNVADVLYNLGWSGSRSLGYRGQLTTKDLYEYVTKQMPPDEDLDEFTKHFPQMEDLMEPEDEFEQSSIDEEIIQNISKGLNIDESTVLAEHAGITIGGDQAVQGQNIKTISTTELVKFISEYIGATAVIKGRTRTYTRPSRRLTSSEFVMPGYKQYKNVNKIDIYLDTSGSMSTALVDNLFATLKTLYQSTKFNLYQFDYEITKVDLEKRDSIRVGGGTNIQKVLDKITKENADHSIVITDCYDNFSLRNITNDLMIFTNNTGFKSDNEKVRLTYFK